MVIGSCHAFPLFLGFIELVGPDHGDHEVHLHELLLLRGHVLVGKQLLLDALTELVPVQVTYQLFESLFVHVIGLLEGVDVQFYEVLVLDGLGQGVSGLRAVLYLVEFLVKCIQCVHFLHFESGKFSVFSAVFPGDGEGLEQGLERLLV